MLKEIICDEFKNQTGQRGKITFHKGLNCVVGTNDAKNSIGKSTFLMIIDFVFGGKDYTEKLSDIMKEVPPHTIYFAFDFGQDVGVKYFSRSTNNPNRVFICDDKYTEIESLSLDNYMLNLANFYNLPSDISLRNAISRSSRIYKRDTLNETKPLQESAKQSTKEEITGLLKLFDTYSDIISAKYEMEEIDKKKKAFSASSKYGFIVTPANISDVKNNEQNIQTLEKRANELQHQIDNNVADLDSIALNRIAPLKEQLMICNANKASIETEIREIRARQSNEYSAKRKDYVALLEFFNDVDIERIQMIEAFHKGLSKILSEECRSQVQHLEKVLSPINKKIEDIKNEISSIAKDNNCSKAVLDEYSSIKSQIDKLIKANGNYRKKKELDDELEEKKARYNSVVVSITTEIQQRINSEMARICNNIAKEKRTSPVLEIKDSSHYTFKTPKDDGTGTNYKGLIVFDLALLVLTNLPVVIHDSLLLKQIEDDTLESILKIYDTQNKQVFIAIDKLDSYSATVRDIVGRNKILCLGPNGDELFGRSWAIENKN